MPPKRDHIDTFQERDHIDTFQEYEIKLEAINNLIKKIVPYLSFADPSQRGLACSPTVFRQAIKLSPAFKDLHLPPLDDNLTNIKELLAKADQYTQTCRTILDTLEQYQNSQTLSKRH